MKLQTTLHKAGLALPEPETPYAEIVDAWLRGYSAHTRRAYLTDLRAWASATGVTLPELAELSIRASPEAYTAAIKRWAGKLSQDETRATSSRLRALVALRSWVAHIGDFRRDGLAPRIRSPRYRASRASVQVRGEYLGQIDRVLAKLEGGDRRDTRDRAIILLLHDSGLRAGSVASLRLQDFHGDAVSARMKARGGARDNRPISRRARKAIERWIDLRGKAPGSLFEISDRHVYDVIRKRGLGYPHKLRHAAATRLADETGDVFLVRDFLAHSDVSTTSVYVDRSAENARKGTDILGG